MITYLEKEIRKIKKEGREEGLQEGWQERNASLAVAMLRKGFDMATITELTGLSEERLRELSRKAES
jgi:predicted transposase/invertase (TIGR01784 family)